jgi:hypothetical protein
MSEATRARTKVRYASFADYNQIAALQIRNGLRESSRERWEELWRGNPALREREAEWPLGWVLETAAGEIVGFIGNVPLAFHFKGRELRAATGIGWTVDKPYRGYSMQLLHQLLKQRDIDLFPFATVGSGVEPLLKACNFARVPVGTWNRSAFWVTNYHGFWASALRMRSVPFNTVIAYFLAGALFSWDAFKRFERQAGKQIHEVEQHFGFDSRFDEFWQELKSEQENRLLAVRTRETLEWHFKDSLLRKCAWVLTVTKGSRLTAYAIFDRQDHPAIGLKRVRLVDFQSLKGSEDALHSLLSWGLLRCREQRVHVLEVIGCWLGRPDLPHIVPPHCRRLFSWAYYYKATDKRLCEALNDPQSWAPSSFDGDASLYTSGALG